MTSPNPGETGQQDIQKLAKAEKAQNVVDQQTVAAAAGVDGDKAKPAPASDDEKDVKSGR